MKKNIWFLTILIVSFCFLAKAQIIDGQVDLNRSNSGRVRSSQEVETLQRMRDEAKYREQSNQMTGRFSNSNGDFVKKRLKMVRKLISVNSEVKTKYKAFLKLNNTGIVKFSSGNPCSLEGNLEEDNLDKLALACPYKFIAGNGKYFSFRQKDYVINNLSDLESLNGFFVTNGMDNQEILVNIGDIEIEKVDLSTKGLEFLKNFVPSINAEEIGKQYMQIWDEVESDGFRYAKMLPIEANKTYAVRAVAYERDVDSILTEKQKKLFPDHELRKLLLDPLRGDNRVDVIIALRVLEKNADGTVTIIWKELQRKNSPFIGGK